LEVQSPVRKVRAKAKRKFRLHRARCGLEILMQAFQVKTLHELSHHMAQSKASGFFLKRLAYELLAFMQR
jgi:hypothetical protein